MPVSDSVTMAEHETLRGRVAALETICMVLLGVAARDEGHNLIADQIITTLVEATEGVSGPFVNGLSELMLEFESKLRGD